MRTLWISALLFSMPAWAQEFRASITGTVTDATGAPILGATVQAVNLERQVTSEAVTNESGVYLIRFLTPGKYDVIVRKDGFKELRRSALELFSSDRARVDATLEVGDLQQRVSVTAEAPLLSTETASRSLTLEQKYVDDLPTSGRNMYQLLFSQPGIIKTSRYWGNFELYAFGNINSISINGGRSGENETLIDGITSVRGNRSASFAPALNAIQEVAVQSNSYDAQYGRFGGGVTTVTLRSGTNDLHGQLFEFFKNDNLNAAGVSRNTFGVPRPEYKNNTFGFTLDGPVVIPGLFNGRNKLFWMLSLEALRERNPQTQLWTVPTEAERRGDFSGLRTADGRPITIYDPLTTQQVGNTFVRQPFPGNRIPAERINPVAARAISFFPAPNRVSESPDGLNNYLFLNSSRNSYNQWLGKMDWAVTDRHRLSWRYGETPWYNYARVQWGTNAAEPSGEFPSTRISRNWGADWTWTISASTVFNLRGGLARYEGFSGNEFGRGFDPRELGFPNDLVSQFTSLQYPRFNFTGNNISPLGATTTSNYETSDTWSLQPNMQSIIGRHSIKYGTEVRLYNANNIRPNSAAGNYTFSRNWTQLDPQRADALSGSAIASFLLGHPTSGYVDRNMDPAYQNMYYALFFQDDWKLARNLTINFGLRWDYESPVRERYNRQVRGFDFDAASPLASQVQGLNLRGGLLYAGTSGDERLAFEKDLNNIQPRIGIAWQPADKWVVRGGWGLYYLGQNATGPDTGFSRPTSLIASTDSDLTPAVTLSDPFPRSQFPSGLLQPIGNSQGLATNLGLGVNAQWLARNIANSQQFSFGFQRTLGTSWLFDTSYVGNLTDGLPVSLDLNFIPGQELTRLPVAERAAYFNAQVPNPMRGLLPGSALNGATIPRQRLLVAFPQFNQVNINNVPIGKQTYHSWQNRLSRRFASGWTAQASYTWGKTLEQVSLLNPQDVDVTNLLNTPLEKRLAEFDIPHTFSGVFSWELPFGRGRRWMGSNRGIVDGIFGGWNISGQYLWRSGQPLEFPNAAPLEARSAKVDRSGDWNPIWDPAFDTSLFPRTAISPFELRTFPTRFPDVRSTYLQSWELSGYKNFRITEKVTTQLRADFQNAFNYAHFGRLAARPNNVQDSRFGLHDPSQDNGPRSIVLVLKVLF